MTIIQAEHVTVSYLMGNFRNIGLKEYVIRQIRKEYSVKEFLAIHDVTFSLVKGDMLGIIGSNGSGKSTLLKNIAGIMPPTNGYLEVNGQVAALLELGSGFDMEMTVRENTYLRGALLGYPKSFIDGMYDEIIAFAELQDFQDFNFMQLSTGMKSRLAFAIACLVKPDILILDEVLAVGDGAFLEKSKKKMMEVLNSGVTALMVSHSIAEIRQLCNKVLWLEKGKQIDFGTDVKRICDQYIAHLKSKN